MKQHTQGEWVVSETYLDGCLTVIAKVTAPEKKNIICDIWGMDTEEGRANAKLIAAAPELLEALEYLLKGVNDLPPLTAISGVLTQQCKEAESAIKKATG